jgi:hypothetical protein
MKVTAPSYQSSRVESLQLEPSVPQHSASFRIFSQEDLEATVQQKTIHFIGSDASSNSIRSLKYSNLPASLVQMDRTAKARNSSANNQDGLFFHGCKL